VNDAIAGEEAGLRQSFPLRLIVDNMIVRLGKLRGASCQREANYGTDHNACCTTNQAAIHTL
jgi:hypothetical protein